MCSHPAIQPRAAPPGQLDDVGHAPIAAAQQAFEQARLRSWWHFTCTLLIFTPPLQVLMRPVEILARLHAVPLIRRVRPWARSSTRWRSPSRNRPRTSLPIRAIVSAMSTMPSRSTGRSPGSPHMKYSFTCVEAVGERLAAAVVQILVVDLLANLLAHVVAGHLRRQRQPASAARCRSDAATTCSCSFTRRLGNDNAHAQRLEHLLHPPHELLRSTDSRWSKATTAKSRCARCCDTIPAPPARSSPPRECAAAA